MQLLVRVVSKTDPKDPVKDAQLTKAGDVIVYKQDGEEWGIMELKNPEWRIIQVPGMTEEEAQALVSPELPPDLNKEYPLLQRRAMKLDINQLDVLCGSKISADQSTKIAEMNKLLEDVDTKKKSEVDLKQYLADNAVDASVAKIDVMSIATLKETLVDIKEIAKEIGDGSNIIGAK